MWDIEPGRFVFRLGGSVRWPDPTGRDVLHTYTFTAVSIGNGRQSYGEVVTRRQLYFIYLVAACLGLLNLAVFSGW